MSSLAQQPVQHAKGPLPLLVGVAAGLTALVFSLLQKSRSSSEKKKYSGHADVVSYSSRMIAVSRALEMRRAESDRLFDDPLAEFLAGPEAIANAEEKDRVRLATNGSADRSRFAVRTRYFDDALLEALGAIDALHQRPPWVPIPRGWSDKKPTQVVLLGAGMDSRAWRLKLPSGITWFELDRKDVLDVKLQLLKENGAQVDTKRSTGAAAASAFRFPLKADRYVPVVADLGSARWPDQLRSAGFNPDLATVWLAEGLLMYLSAAEVHSLFAAARALSGKGSVFLASAVNEETIKGARTSTSDLMRTWKWGCPDSPAEFLKALGWQQVSCVALGDPTASYGRVTRDPTNPKKTRTLYIRSKAALLPAPDREASSS